MNRAWGKFMLCIHGCVGVGMMGLWVKVHSLVFAGMLAAVALYSMGWYAEPSRRDAIFRMADVIQMIALTGFAASLGAVLSVRAIALAATRP